MLFRSHMFQKVFVYGCLNFMKYLYVHLLFFSICVMTGNFNLRSILDANKLTRPNFKDWYQNVKIVLHSKKIAYVSDSPIPVAPTKRQDRF